MAVSTLAPSFNGPTQTCQPLGQQIMSLPPELYLRIFAELCSPEGNQGWLPRKDRYPPFIMNEGIRTYYGSKKLIIELSNLTPYTSQKPKPKQKQNACLSILRMYDTDRDLDLDIKSSVSAIYPGSYQHHGSLKLSELGSCPFNLFSRITIKIPPCKDPLSLVATWARLNIMGYILGTLAASHNHAINKSSLPWIDIVFENCGSWSWTESNGKPKLCPTSSDELRLEGDSRPPSILVILLRALYQLRGRPNIKVRVPDDFPRSERERKFSLTWMEDQPLEPRRKEPELLKWLEICDNVLPKMFFTTSPGSTLPRSIQHGYELWLRFPRELIKSGLGTLSERQSILERALQRIAEALELQASRKSLPN